MKKYMTPVVLLMSIIFYCLLSSCKKEEDKCKDIVCPDHGYCDIYTGECKCESGYEGTNCDTLWRTKFIGEFQGFWNSAGVIRNDSLKIVDSLLVKHLYVKPKVVTGIFIDDAWGGTTADYSDGTVTSSTTFTYTFNATNFMETTKSGEGTIKGDTLTFVYRTHGIFNVVMETHTFIGIRQ